MNPNTKIDQQIIMAIFKANMHGSLWNYKVPVYFGELLEEYFPENGGAPDDYRGYRCMDMEGYTANSSDFFSAVVRTEWVRNNRAAGRTHYCAYIILNENKTLPEWQEYITKNRIAV